MKLVSGKTNITGRGVFRGGHWAMPPFGSPGLHNCIEKWAKLRHGHPLCKLGIRLWAQNHLILGGKWDEIWMKTFFFAPHLILGENWDKIWVKTFFMLFTWFWAKTGTKFEWRPFFFCSLPDFGRKMGRNLSEDLFFALHLILGEKWDEIWVWQFQILIYVPLKFSEVSAPPFKILRTLLITGTIKD